MIQNTNAARWHGRKWHHLAWAGRSSRESMIVAAAPNKPLLSRNESSERKQNDTTNDTTNNISTRTTWWSWCSWLCCRGSSASQRRSYFESATGVQDLEPVWQTRLLAGHMQWTIQSWIAWRDREQHDRGGVHRNIWIHHSHAWARKRLWWTEPHESYTTMIYYLLTSTFFPVALLLAWVLYTDYQIKKQAEERQDDE